MKVLLSILILCFSSIVSAQCFNGANGNCPAEMPPEPEFVNPAGPVIIFSPAPVTLLFDSHEETERHYYHCAEGIALWGDLIKQSEPAFEGVLPKNYVETRINQDCTGKLKIYSTSEDDPKLGVCSLFEDQEIAQINYDLCKTTNFQYWDKLQSLMSKPKEACANPMQLADGAHRGNLSKPTADPGARCRNGWTVLLDSKYKDTTKLSLLDKNGEDKGLAEYFGFYQGSRPRFCFHFPGSKFGNDPVYFTFMSAGQGQCLKVKNASQRED